MRFCLSLLLLSLLSACGTISFTPAEYPLRDGLITAFKVAGPTTVTNGQPSTDETIVYSYMGSKLASNLHAITEVMVQQTAKELAKSGQVNSAGSPKSIMLRVDSLLSEYTNAFFWKSNIRFQATLGNGAVVTKTVPHTSGVLQQDLNGCIAEGVMALLNDGQVRAYLAQ
jgi:hypothetical protein